MANHNIEKTEIWSYLSNNADEATKKKVETWINSDNYDDHLFRKTKNIYNTSGNNPFVDTDTQSAKNRFFDSIENKKVTQQNWKNLLKYAAAIAMLIMSCSLVYQFFLPNLIVVETSFGEHKKVELPDGSVVWLNASTTLSYAEDAPRQLNLEGEAFFEVAKNKAVPFVVTTHDNILVKALGTSFNIKSYKETSYTETILLTGKVEVTSNKHFDEKIEMLPRDKVVFFNKKKHIQKFEAQLMEDVKAWRKGKIQFRNKQFKEIAQDLNIQFNVKITFENKQIAHTRFTGSFDEKTPIMEILETLKETKNFNYTKSKNSTWHIQ